MPARAVGHLPGLRTRNSRSSCRRGCPISPALGALSAELNTRRSTSQGSAAASRAYGAAWSWGVYGKYNDPDDPGFYERQQKYDDAELAMLGLMRNRLAIREGDLELPPPGDSYSEVKVPEPDDPAGV